MAVPKRKTSRSKRDMRRANHDRVTPPNAIPCPSCGDMTLPHRVCPACGQYKGRKIVGKADEAAAAPEATPASE